MTAQDATTVLDALESAGVSVSVDGGWGVDTLLGRETRAHDDLDLVVSLADSDHVARSLRVLGFTVHADERPTRLVLADDHDRRIDLHTVAFDEGGDGYQTLPDGSRFCYTRSALSGHGRIGGRAVTCLTAGTQVECHLGYEPDDDDRRDMELLARAFSLVLPPPYRSPTPDR